MIDVAFECICVCWVFYLLNGVDIKIKCSNDFSNSDWWNVWIYGILFGDCIVFCLPVYLGKIDDTWNVTNCTQINTCSYGTENER